MRFADHGLDGRTAPPRVVRSGGGSGISPSRDDQVIPCRKNEAASLPIGAVHRLANPGKIDFEMIEARVGSNTAADDSVGFERGDGCRRGDTR